MLQDIGWSLSGHPRCRHNCLQCCHLSTCFRSFLSSLSYISGPCRNACVQSFACNYRSDIGWLVSTVTHVFCTLDRRFFSCFACCTHRVKGQIDDPFNKKQVLVSKSLLDQEVKASENISAAELRRYFTPVWSTLTVHKCSSMVYPATSHELPSRSPRITSIYMHFIMCS